MSHNEPLPQMKSGAGCPALAGTCLPPATEVREPLPDFKDSADLRDYLEVILRRKWLVLTILATVFMATLVVNLTAQPLFRAIGRLELSRQAPRVTKFEDVTAGQLHFMEFIQTHVKLLQSTSLMRRVSEKLRLDQHPLFSPDQTTRHAKPAADGTDPAAQSQRMKSIEQWLAGNLQVQPERDTTIISLLFMCADPDLARDVVNTIIQEFIGWQMDKRIDAASSAKEQLGKQIEHVRIQLEKSEANLNQFAQKAGIVSLNSNLNLVYRQLEEINNALVTAESERVAAEALYKQARSTPTGSLSRVMASELIQKLRAELARSQAEYQELNVIFRDDYPAAKKLKARMHDIRRKIAGEEARMAAAIENDYRIAVHKEKELRQSADEKRRLALQLNDQTTQYKILEREVETNNQIYQSLLVRAKEIDANVGTELGNIQVVDYADVPSRPFKPNVSRNLLFAVVFGLLGGVGAAFLLEYFDNTLKRVDEIADRFQIPLLGLVPLVKGDEAKNLETLVLSRPRCGFSEAVRTAKVSIELSSTLDRPPQSILITSTACAEGKSTIAANLAQAFASSEEKVVLIDADMRKPRLHNLFSTNGNRRRKGLSHYLSGMCEMEEIIRRTDVSDLSFIAAGPIPPNPAELLASRRMKKLLQGLAAHFDRIIMDAPPYSGFSDVLVLGHLVDGVIVISTLGQTHREALSIFRRGLFNVGGHLLGSIVNKLNVYNHYGHYYSRYARYYHYHQAFQEPLTAGGEQNVLP